MNAFEMLPLLEKWAAIHLELKEADEKLDALTGRAPESQLCNAMWKTFDAYSEALEVQLIGRSDSDWLEWYRFECQMGARGMDVQLVEGGPMVEIRTLDDLARLLESCP